MAVDLLSAKEFLDATSMFAEKVAGRNSRKKAKRAVEHAKSVKEAAGAEEPRGAEEAKCVEEAKGTEEAKVQEEAKGTGGGQRRRGG